MTFAVSANIATMILCIAVLIQTVRLMRALDTVKSGALTDVVTALDRSTGEARRVLGKLTELLRGDVAVTSRTLGEGRAMIEELTVMTGIANAIAERIVDAAGASNHGARGAAATAAVSTVRKRRVNWPPSSAAPADDDAATALTGSPGKARTLPSTKQASKPPQPRPRKTSKARSTPAATA
jgi:hypothetical protein